MTLEELSIEFSANTVPVQQSLIAISALMDESASRAADLEGKMADAGAEAGSGLARGILSRRESVAQAARAVADAAALALRSALQIHSPSKVTMQAGQSFDEGFLRGISESCARVEKEAGGMGLRAAEQVSAEGKMDLPQIALSKAETGASPLSGSQSEVINLTIPLQVDGYQLGVAAIEGINRVSRATGRVELSI